MTGQLGSKTELTGHLAIGCVGNDYATSGLHLSGGAQLILRAPAGSAMLAGRQGEGGDAATLGKAGRRREKIPQLPGDRV